MWYDNESVENGLSFWPVAIGGWNSTDHMPSTVGATANPDSKYDLAASAEWLSKCVAPDCDRVFFRIQIGQNAIASGDFAEGSGTDLGNYKSNVEAIIAYWRAICAAAGKTPYFYLVSTQNTIVGGARMQAMAVALREIALAASDVGFFDLRGAVIDAELTDEDQIMLASISADSVHTTQLGAEQFMALEWEALSTALPPSTGGLSSMFFLKLEPNNARRGYA
jgi:hypothetical protein